MTDQPWISPAVQVWLARYLASATECALVPEVPLNPALPRREAYVAYLQTPEWKSRRAARLDFQRGRCLMCPKPAAHVHHRTYERLGAEPLEDLVALCLVCHLRHHEKLLAPLDASEPTGADLVRWYRGLPRSKKSEVLRELPPFGKWPDPDVEKAA